MLIIIKLKCIEQFVTTNVYEFLPMLFFIMLITVKYKYCKRVGTAAKYTGGVGHSLIQRVYLWPSCGPCVLPSVNFVFFLCFEIHEIFHNYLFIVELFQLVIQKWDRLLPNGENVRPRPWHNTPVTFAMPSQVRSRNPTFYYVFVVRQGRVSEALPIRLKWFRDPVRMELMSKRVLQIERLHVCQVSNRGDTIVNRQDTFQEIVCSLEDHLSAVSVEQMDIQ